MTKYKEQNVCHVGLYHCFPMHFAPFITMNFTFRLPDAGQVHVNGKLYVSFNEWECGCTIRDGVSE